MKMKKGKRKKVKKDEYYDDKEVIVIVDEVVANATSTFVIYDVVLDGNAFESQIDVTLSSIAVVIGVWLLLD